MIPIRKHLALTLVLVVFTFSGCTREAVGRPKPSPPVPAASVPPPLRVVVFVDQSRSMEAARVAPVSAANFLGVYERFAASGGELAVGLIRDDSDRPFARLYIPPPPDVPAAQALPQNVFAAAVARKRENEERARSEEAQRVWRAEMGSRQAAFARSIEPLLARPADAPATDIFSALRRADVLLSEPNVFPRGTRNVVILVSDGVETVADGAAAPRLNAPAEIVLVNGAGAIGSLSSLAPVRFESLDAALRYAVSKGGAHGRQ